MFDQEKKRESYGQYDIAYYLAHTRNLSFAYEAYAVDRDKQCEASAYFTLRVEFFRGYETRLHKEMPGDKLGEYCLRCMHGLLDFGLFEKNSEYCLGYESLHSSQVKLYRKVVGAGFCCKF